MKKRPIILSQEWNTPEVSWDTPEVDWTLPETDWGDLLEDWTPLPEGDWDNLFPETWEESLERLSGDLSPLWDTPSPWE